MTTLEEKPKTPEMPDKDVKSIEYLIEYGQPDHILEWGSGGSTIYFSYKYQDIFDSYLAIEDDSDWHDYVNNNVFGNTSVYYRKPINYYSDILKMGKNFDLILIDGRYRQACMVVAKQIVTENGIVLLHDSERDIYDSVHGLFEYNKQITEDVKYEMDNMTFTHKGLRGYWDE